MENAFVSGLWGNYIFKDWIRLERANGTQSILLELCVLSEMMNDDGPITWKVWLVKDRKPVTPQPSKLQRNYTDVLLVGQVSSSLKYA